MKLATRKDGTRDGQLTVVSRDLKQAVLAEQIVGTLQDALDDWRFFAPQLQQLYEQLNLGRAPRSFDFDPLEYMAPLPRPFARIVATAYPAGPARLRKAGLLPAASEASAPAEAEHPPFALAPTSRSMPGTAPVSLSGLALHLGHDSPEAGDSGTASAVLAAPESAAAAPALAGESAQGQHGLDFGAQLVAITDDAPMDLELDEAEAHILLLGLANGWRIHPPGPGHWLADRGLAWAPVVLSPDELGEDWRDGRVQRPVHCRLNGRSTGRLHAAEGMHWDFRQLLVSLCQQEPVHAGCVISSGPIANTSLDSGFGSIIDARAKHRLDGQPGAGPAFLQAGSRIRIDMADARGHSLFGSIDQQVVS